MTRHRTNAGRASPVVSVTLERATLAALDILASARGISRSAEVRAAILERWRDYARSRGLSVKLPEE